MLTFNKIFVFVLIVFVTNGIKGNTQTRISMEKYSYPLIIMQFVDGISTGNMLAVAVSFLEKINYLFNLLVRHTSMIKSLN